ncbi:hypothetical protein BG418_30805 [Streptomyces sp. CBMA152]|nr:hypothetical protein [Streptomyces sp. CBMA152]
MLAHNLQQPLAGAGFGTPARTGKSDLYDVRGLVLRPPGIFLFAGRSDRPTLLFAQPLGEQLIALALRSPKDQIHPFVELGNWYGDFEAADTCIDL